MPESLASQVGSLDALVAEVVDDFRERQKRGERPDPEEYAARHPHAADLLRKVLASLRLVGLSGSDDGATAGGPDDVLTGILGDFRLFREVGRGGMGVVYEAEQISLGRRVALKVLPFAATMDPRQLQRFHNEARAAASLHHPHIVPVHAVGQERGVHYYAMQFIDGVTLGEFLRRARAGRGETVDRSHGSGASADSDQPTVNHSPPAASAQTVKAEVTAGEARGLNDWRLVARLGIEAAEALEHAHSVGIVHRDVKPGNLMIDGHGKLWVTDFGLARLDSDTGLTMTGDLVGTLRYMSPEQALAKHGLVDHRTDVYSLGVTLYELLTGVPAVAGMDKQEILRHVVEEEPPLPRSLNRAVPHDLETVVLKALAKEPHERYATAKDLAEDLRRFAGDEPVRARRPTVVQRARRWARRNKALVGSLAAGLLLAVLAVAGSVGWVLGDQAAQRTKTALVVTGSLDEALEQRRQQDWPKAWAAARRAEDLLTQGSPSDELWKRVRDEKANLVLLETLQEIQLQLAAGPGFGFDYAAVDGEYARVFGQLGFDVEALSPEESARRFEARGLGAEMAPTLDHWSLVRHKARPGDESWKHLLAVARAVDPDSRRDQVRAAVAAMDRRALENAPASSEARLLPATLVLLGLVLREMDAVEESVRVLRQAQRDYPADFWVNHELAGSLSFLPRPPHDEVVSYFTAAVALRPESPLIRFNLGVALNDHGHHDGAIAVFREAIRLNPRLVQAYNNLGNALADKGQLDEAVAVFRQALEIDPTYARLHFGLGNFLAKQGKKDEARAAFEKASAGDKTNPEMVYNLGIILKENGAKEEALAAFREAIRRDPNYAEAHAALGEVLLGQGKRDEAIAAFEETVRRKPDYRPALDHLGAALCSRGEAEKAVAVFVKAAAVSPDAQAYNNLAIALEQCGRLDEAIKAYRRSIRLQPDVPEVHINLGFAFQKKGLLEEAVVSFKECLRLEPKFAAAHNALAWLLATCSNARFRDPQRALEHSIKAVELAPEDAGMWNTHGVALNRAGDWAASIQALEKSVKLSRGGEATDFFFLAMAHGQLGNKEQARPWFDKAVQWMDRNKPKDEELLRFRAEAAELLDVKAPQATPDK